MTKPEAKNLCNNRTFDEVKAILKAEGQIYDPEQQFTEWWDVFELTRLCDKAGLSELEKWCVLANRFQLIKK